ncbi:MAG: hypothetical protein M1825_003317 [Sarcosagium campestre]|nr:MAG: hypothetical protein M1825_003317 [Sarcosagium campestre]
MLAASGIHAGRFTSPHLIDRWDCVMLGTNVVSEDVFNAAEARVRAKDKDESIGATEFELLTATAFDIFSLAKVDVGVVEVGLGGRLDATNVIEDPLVTVISKIGLDHQGLLGNTIEEIAWEKAGIMKPGVPCVVDATNTAEVRHVIREHAREVGAGPIICTPVEECEDLWGVLDRGRYEPHQQANAVCAAEAARIAVSRFSPAEDFSQILRAMEHTNWPGRLQIANICSLTGRAEAILIDGAHNQQSAQALAMYIDGKLRKKDEAVTWVLAASKGKDIDAILPILLRPGDQVVAVEFGRVEGMPWVSPSPTKDLLNTIESSMGTSSSIVTHDSHDDVSDALQTATELAAGGPLVVAGSLYLVSDVLRLVKNDSLSGQLLSASK